MPGIVDTLQSMLADLDLPQVDPRTDWQARAYPGSVRAINRQKLRDEVARILD